MSARPSVASSQEEKNVAPLWAAFFQNCGCVGLDSDEELFMPRVRML